MSDYTYFVGKAIMLTDYNWDIPCCEVLEAVEFIPRIDGEIEFYVFRYISSNVFRVQSSVNYTVNGMFLFGHKHFG